MVNPRYSPFEHIVKKQKAVQQHLENSARLAYSFGTFETVGWGEYTFEDRIDFEVAYLQRPACMYGCSVDTDDSDDLRATRYPRGSGQVLRWDIDKAGLYRGAWVIVEVEDRSPFITRTDPDEDPNYTLLHDFTFIGVAMKTLDTATLNKDVNFV